jgi:hypothetical protein
MVFLIRSNKSGDTTGYQLAVHDDITANSNSPLPSFVTHILGLP